MPASSDQPSEQLNEIFSTHFPWLRQAPSPSRGHLSQTLGEAGPTPVGNPERQWPAPALSSSEAGSAWPPSVKAEPAAQGPGGRQYLIAPATGEVQLAGGSTLSMGELRSLLARDSSIALVPKGNRGELSLPAAVLNRSEVADAGPPGVFVVRMSEQRAAELRAQHAGIHIEEDLPLRLLAEVAAPPRPAPTDIGLLPLGLEYRLQVEVRGAEAAGPPLEGVALTLVGSLWPAQGVTDANGRATLTLYGESAEEVQGLMLRPRHSYWGRWVDGAALQGGAVTITLQQLGAANDGFPERQMLGWGQRAMGLDNLPAQYGGAGVKVAVVDSGIQAAHPDLRANSGVDFTGGSRQTWGVDSIGHGSHCAGIIAARNDARGVRGFAPDAEVHVLKIFPGGRTSDLIDALNYCIEHEIDIVNMSLGSPERSELLGQRIAQARQAGVACIAAAGNTAGPVQYPAAFDTVLAVGALGRQDAYPRDSCHSKVAEGDKPSSDGYYAAKFTCFGDQVDVAAPGVAIISTVPPDGYAAMDGTSMAAPHISGLAALVLAHREDIRQLSRSEQRVAALFDAIRGSAQALAGGDAQRLGKGLPSVPRALKLPERPAAQLDTAELQRLLEALEEAAAAVRAAAGLK